MKRREKTETDLRELAIDAKLQTIAEVGAYGLEWMQGQDERSDRHYKLGGIETVGHQIACLIVQWITPDESLPTCDVVTGLKLSQLPGRPLLLRRLRIFVKALRKL